MPDSELTIRIPFFRLKSEFLRILQKLGFSEDGAEKCADIFAVNSLEGVYSHGVNRFPRFVKTVREGYVKPGAVPTLVHRSGSIEQWNGNLGPGPLNASFATERVMELAQENSIGLIALANTNHWMRAGSYGWQAARQGFVLICWTNTCANMPAWGATDPRLGNNPFVIAVPYEKEAVVLDFAMSQFSYGKMEIYRDSGMLLPYPGGYNSRGELTFAPAEILETWRAIPAGYWKGAGFSLLLDILAAILAGGLSTHQVNQRKVEHGLSQVFIAVNIRNLKNFPSIDNSINQIIADLKKSTPANEDVRIRFPGENVVLVRNENLRKGIPINKGLWEKLLGL